MAADEVAKDSAGQREEQKIVECQPEHRSVS
jgi:hypothetical protein